MVRGPKAPYVATQGLYLIPFPDANPVLKCVQEGGDLHELFPRWGQVAGRRDRRRRRLQDLLPHQGRLSPGRRLPRARRRLSRRAFPMHILSRGNEAGVCTLKRPSIRPGSDGGFSCDTLFDACLRQAGRARESACAPCEEVILSREVACGPSCHGPGACAPGLSVCYSLAWKESCHDWSENTGIPCARTRGPA